MGIYYETAKRIWDKFKHCKNLEECWTVELSYADWLFLSRFGKHPASLLWFIETEGGKKQDLKDKPEVIPFPVKETKVEEKKEVVKAEEKKEEVKPEPEKKRGRPPKEEKPKEEVKPKEEKKKKAEVSEEDALDDWADLDLDDDSDADKLTEEDSDDFDASWDDWDADEKE